MIDIFSKRGWTIPIKKSAQAITKFLENILIKAERSLNLIETDHGKQF